MTASGGSLLILPRIMTSILACMGAIHRQDYKVFLYSYYFSIFFSLVIGYWFYICCVFPEIIAELESHKSMFWSLI